jgi:hypothetical protein
MEKAVVRTLHREWKTPLKKKGEVVRKHLAA